MSAPVQTLLFPFPVLEFFPPVHESQTEIVPAGFPSLHVGLPSQYCVPCGFGQPRLSAYLTDRFSTLPVGITTVMLPLLTMHMLYDV